MCFKDAWNYIQDHKEVITLDLTIAASGLAGVPIAPELMEERQEAATRADWTSMRRTYAQSLENQSTDTD